VLRPARSHDEPADPVRPVLDAERVHGSESLVDVVVADEREVDPGALQQLPERTGMHLVVTVRTGRRQRGDA